MRIGIIGAGISGLGAALALHGRHNIVLFEKEARLGGHAHTVDADYDGVRVPVDTGFIVCNSHNYPNFLGMLAHLGVDTFDSDMSFAVSDPEGYEWSSNGIGGVFAWKRNIASPAFLCMLNDIVRFSAQARADLREDRLNTETLEEYVARLRLSRGFLRHYLLPMGEAIWSTPEKEMLRYPAASFLRFFDNHRLLHARRPVWRSVSGGSRSYVNAIRTVLGSAVRSGDPVARVTTLAQGVQVHTQSGLEEVFDHVILACHADEALALLDNPTPEVAQALAAIRFGPNTAYLHRDPALMPRRRAAWASWNYMRGREDNGRVTVSYWMNLLQNIDHSRPLFVTLNPDTPPREDLTFGCYAYRHPLFDTAAIAAQKSLRALQGRNGLSFAGAWLGYGFHEDGLKSGLEAAAGVGVWPAWAAARDGKDAPPAERPIAAARAA